MKSVLIKETMKEIKGNIIGGILLLNFSAKIKFHIASRAQNCYNSVGVCSSNSLATRRGMYQESDLHLAFILLNLLTTSAYPTSTLLFSIL